MNIYVSVSIGELWDKYTILLIKKNKIQDPIKLEYVNREIEYLNENMNKFSYENNILFLELKNINEKLWDIEDQIRIKEINNSFDQEFIDLARKVYYINDDRAEIKKKINIEFNSAIHEVKDYINYK